MPHQEQTSRRHERHPPLSSLFRSRTEHNVRNKRPALEPQQESRVLEPQVMVLGDGTLSAAIAAASLRSAGYRVHRHDEMESFLRSLSEGAPAPDLAVVDSGYQPERVGKWLVALRRHSSTLPLLLIAGDPAMLRLHNVAARVKVQRVLEPPVLPSLMVEAAEAALGRTRSQPAPAQPTL